MEPVDDGRRLLDRLVAKRRAKGPTTTGPIPVPPPLGDPDVDAAEHLAAAREDERW